MKFKSSHIQKPYDVFVSPLTEIRISEAAVQTCSKKIHTIHRTVPAMGNTRVTENESIAGIVM